MTGLELVHLLCPEVPVVIGERNVYDPFNRCIVLSPRAATGTERASLLMAAHELAHHWQNEKWPLLVWMARILPFRILLELDAWRVALWLIFFKSSLTETKIPETSG